MIVVLKNHVHLVNHAGVFLERYSKALIFSSAVVLSNSPR